MSSGSRPRSQSGPFPIDRSTPSRQLAAHAVPTAIHARLSPLGPFARMQRHRRGDGARRRELRRSGRPAGGASGSRMNARNWLRTHRFGILAAVVVAAISAACLIRNGSPYFEEGLLTQVGDQRLYYDLALNLLRRSFEKSPYPV